MSSAASGAPDAMRYGAYEGSHGEGWVIFAGIIIMIAGTLNFIYGIAAIANSHFYVANTNYVVGDLKAWGWAVMLLGVLQFCVALGIWVRAGWARWAGVLVAGLNAIAQLLFIAAYPLLTVAIIALDVLVIYGLVAYGKRVPEPM